MIIPIIPSFSGIFANIRAFWKYLHEMPGIFGINGRKAIELHYWEVPRYYSTVPLYSRKHVNIGNKRKHCLFPAKEPNTFEPNIDPVMLTTIIKGSGFY